MKLGIILAGIGTIMAVWFFVLPIGTAMCKLPLLLTGDLPLSQLCNWPYFGISLTIGFFLGGIPLVIGKERISKALAKREAQ